MALEEQCNKKKTRKNIERDMNKTELLESAGIIDTCPLLNGNEHTNTTGH